MVSSFARTILVMVSFLALLAGCTPASGDALPTGEPGTATIHEPGWATPIKLRFNDDGWEDSPYITRDGRQIIFFYHPYPDLITGFEKALEAVLTNPQRAVEQGIDGKIYVSKRPFVKKEVHPVSRNNQPAAECCFYMSRKGDWFYNSTKEAWELQKSVPEKMYINQRKIDLGTNGEEANPHYCEARDELWFDCPGDTNICQLTNAAKRNFRGTAKLAPFPINSKNTDVVDFQPYLTDDCQTLYFSSTRGGTDAIAIYRSRRIGAARWGQPELFISDPSGVAELSMTADGKQLVFAQLFWRDSGGVGINIYYSRKR